MINNDKNKNKKEGFKKLEDALNKNDDRNKDDVLKQLKQNKDDKNKEELQDTLNKNDDKNKKEALKNL